jgi:hypothetical protein
MEKKVEAEARNLEMERKAAVNLSSSTTPQQGDMPKKGDSLNEGSK